MKFPILASLLLLSSTLVSGCGPSSEPSWVYGEWREFVDGDVVHFRRDMTVSWFGSEGTFDFGRTAQWPACQLGRTCPDGDINVYVDGDRYRVAYTKDQAPGMVWNFRFHNSYGFHGAGVSDYPVAGKTAERIALVRASDFAGGFVPGPVTRLDEGMTDFYPQIKDIERIDGQVVAVTYGGFVHFNEDTRAWESVQALRTYNRKLTPSLALYETGLSAGGSYTWHYSLDQARTFQEMPSFGDVVDNYGFSAEVFIGTTAFQMVRMPAPEGESYDLQPFNLFSIDLGASTPSWTLVQSFAHDFFGTGWNPQLVSSDVAGELYIIACPQMDWENPPTDNCTARRSTTGGTTWEAMADLPVPGARDIKGTDNGFVFTYRPPSDGVAPQSAYWYHQDTQSVSTVTYPEGQWVSTYDIDGEDLLQMTYAQSVESVFEPGMLPSLGNQEIRRLKSDGTNELLVTLNSTEGPGDTANIEVGAGLIILNAGTVWLVE